MNSAVEIAECMFERARRWETYADVTTRPGPAFPPAFTELGHGSGETVFALRCRACGEEIFGTGEGHPVDNVTETDIVRHMLNSHGYRMDGRQFDNQNNEVGHA